MNEPVARSVPLPNAEAIQQASEWFARLNGPSAAPSDQRAWQSWLQDKEANKQAWARVEMVQSKMGRVPAPIGLPVLSRTGSRSKRDALRLGLVAALGLPSAWLISRPFGTTDGQSELVTQTGERRELKLPDGSHLALNTATAVEVNFDRQIRRLSLKRGEIWVETSPDSEVTKRSFVVDTPHGRVMALGTRFTVRVHHDHTRVNVEAHAVQVTPISAPDASVKLIADQQLTITRVRAGEITRADPDGSYWRAGSLVVVDRPMDLLVAELARYRPGYLGCDPLLTTMKVSGAFALADIDRALDALQSSFPVRVQKMTPYWARVVPR